MNLVFHFESSVKFLAFKAKVKLLYRLILRPPETMNLRNWLSVSDSGIFFSSVFGVVSFFSSFSFIIGIGSGIGLLDCFPKAIIFPSSSLEYSAYDSFGFSELTYLAGLACAKEYLR